MFTKRSIDYQAATGNMFTSAGAHHVRGCAKAKQKQEEVFPWTWGNLDKHGGAREAERNLEYLLARLQIQQVFNTYPYDTANWWRAQQKPCLQQQLHPKYPSQNLDILLRRLHDQCFSEDYAYGSANRWIDEQKPCLQQQPPPKLRNLDIVLKKLHDQCFSVDYAFDYLARDSVLEQVMGYKMLFCRKMPTYWQLGYFKVPKSCALDLYQSSADYQRTTENMSTSAGSHDVRDHVEAKQEHEEGSTLTLEDLDIDDGPREAERDLGYVLAKLQSQQVFFTYPYELIDRDSVFDKLRGLKLLVGFVPKHDEIECVLAYVNLLRGQTCTTFVCYMSASEM